MQSEPWDISQDGDQGLRAWPFLSSVLRRDASVRLVKPENSGNLTTFGARSQKDQMVDCQISDFG